jgi:hypothetical protein
VERKQQVEVHKVELDMAEYGMEAQDCPDKGIAVRCA